VLGIRGLEDRGTSRATGSREGTVCRRERVTSSTLYYTGMGFPCGVLLKSFP